MENNMKPCPNCGQNISNIAVMCPNCSYDFLNTTPSKTLQAPEAKPSGVKNFLRAATDKTKALVKAESQKRTELNQLIREQSTQTHTTLQISTGFQQIHTSSVATMYQRPDGTVYFNRNASIRYILLDYMWSGPRFNTITNTVSNTNTTSKTKGKSGKMAAGAVVGTLLLPGVGTAVGAAVGAGGKKKKNSQSITTNNTVQQSRELNTPATLRLKNIESNEYISIVISCNTVIDSQIKCFQFMTEQSKTELVKDTTDSLKGIKALKELLDMGAITQEEFETKKKRLLNN
jgi:hypothetical protein